MTDNVIKGSFGRRKPQSPQKKKGKVSVFMNGCLLHCGEPDLKDMELIKNMVSARKKWINEGRPQSCAFMQK